jgi:hypothetical protein
LKMLALAAVVSGTFRDLTGVASVFRRESGQRGPRGARAYGANLVKRDLYARVRRSSAALASRM